MAESLNAPHASGESVKTDGAAMMSTARGIGRIVGVLLLVQYAAGVVLNFVLMAPVSAPPGFLVNAAAHPLHMGVMVLLGLATGLLSVAIAITAYPAFSRRSHTMALWFVALAVVGLGLNAVENINLMSMLSLSEAYAHANVADHDLYQALRGVVAASRNWAHYIGRIVDGCTLLVFYATLLRMALVPRVLAAFGLGSVALQISAVTMPILGHDIVFLMLLPLGVVHLVLALWLIAKGLRDCP